MSVLIFGEHIIADLSGFLALILIVATAVLMFARKRFSKSPNRGLINKIHIAVAFLGGVFLVIHAEYFIRAPITNFGVLTGYVSTGVALIVWFTGFSFLERLRYSLLYHGSLSLFAIALMVVHSVNLGFSIPLYISEVLLAITATALIVRAAQHLLRFR